MGHDGREVNGDVPSSLRVPLHHREEIGLGEGWRCLYVPSRTAALSGKSLKLQQIVPLLLDLAS